MYQVSVAESIKRILETPIGTRVMRPEFGSRLYELIDKRMDEKWKLDFIRFAAEAINKWEKRVKLVSVELRKIEGSKVYYTLHFDNGEEIEGEFSSVA